MKRSLVLLATLSVWIGSDSALVAQTPASVTWPLSATTTTTATTAGAVFASDQTVTEQYIIRDYAGTDGSQRIYAPGGSGNGLGYWPNETEANLERYAQFVIKPQDGTTLTVTGVSMKLGNSGGSNDVRATVHYSTDGFATSAVLAEAIVLPSSALTDVAYTLSTEVPEGDSLTMRVYPWLNGGRDSGKYFNIADVSIGGTTTGDPVVYLATLTTEPITSLSTTTAVSGGTITSDGGSSVTARGVVYGMAPAPSLANTATEEGEGVGAFLSELNGLTPGETYYVRAYATNSAGTAYGQEVSFTTLIQLSVPTVVTSLSFSVLVTSATFSGEVTFDGGRPVIERGICVADAGMPTTDDRCAASGSGLGTFSVELAGLMQQTNYTARAYAINDQGTAYGNAVSFETKAPAPPIEIVVAQDGSSNYATLQEAFDAVPSRYTGPVTIRVRAGTYAEKAILASDKINVHLIGDGAESTIITWDDYSGRVVDGVTLGTFTSYTVAIDADDFIARDITFQNTYDGSQAVALRVRGDRVAFYNVRMLGFQDTYYTHGRGRVYHKNCYIEGTVDFIFGSSIAIFDDCTIHSKRNSPITAANTEAGYDFGYVFRNATLTADPGIRSATLGRPWGPYAQTIFIGTEMGSHIRPQGWLEWAGNDNHLTAIYAEGGNSGPGYQPVQRVTWAHLLTDAEIDALSLENIFAKESGEPDFAADWLPATSQPTRIADDPGGVLLTALHASYPNPAHGAATVGFNLARPGPVQVRLYNLLGQKMLTLFDGEMPVGAHTIRLDTHRLPAGIYFISLHTHNVVQAQKLVVLH